MKTLTFFFALILPASVTAQTVNKSFTLRGYHYQNAHITRLDGKFASVVHTGGTAKIPIELLPQEIQKQLEPQAVPAAPKEPEISKYQVAANTTEGLIVWNYKKVLRHHSLSTGMSRVGGGGGGGSYTSITWQETLTQSFIPHNAETRDLSIGSNFTCICKQSGTKRIDDTDVIPIFIPEKLTMLAK